jgi:hypothetical protein
MLSCVYGSPYSHNRTQFWDHLMEIGANFSGAWLCLGDFNMILGQSEKSGGLPYACSFRYFFRDFLNTFGMVDLGFSGNPYTWSNHREGRHQNKTTTVSRCCIHLMVLSLSFFCSSSSPG